LEIVGKSWKITFFHTKFQRTPIGWKELKERQYSFSLKSNQPVLDRMLTIEPFKKPYIIGIMKTKTIGVINITQTGSEYFSLRNFSFNWFRLSPFSFFLYKKLLIKIITMPKGIPM
jgi:hypothetical protein